MAFTKEQLAEHRRKLRAKGICTRCHKNKAGDGRRICKDCSSELYGNKMKRVAEGRCRECGVPLDDLRVQICVNCSAFKVQHQFHYRQRLRIMGGYNG